MITPFILKSDESREGKTLNVLGMPVQIKVSAADTGGQLSVFLAAYGKNQGPPLHTHDVDEVFYIIEGDHIFEAAGQRFYSKPGDVVFVPRNTVHTTLCTSDGGGKILFTVNPSAPVEELFQKLDSYPEFPPMEEIVRIHEEMGLKIMGPPLTI